MFKLWSIAPWALHCVQKWDCYAPVGPWGSWKSIELQGGGILHSRREEMPAVKAANVNSPTAFVCPKALHRKALGVSVPWSSSEVNAEHQNGTRFSCPGCGGQAEHLALLLQHPLVLEYKLTLPAAWLSVLLQNFMVSELRCCACWFLLLKCDSNPEANFN